MLAFELAMLLVLLLLFNNAIVNESTSNLDRMFDDGDTNGGNPGNNSKSAPCATPSCCDDGKLHETVA
jgi:hypothetical protein